MYQFSYLVEQVEVLLSQFEWNSRDSPTETRLTDRRFFVIRDSRRALRPYGRLPMTHVYNVRGIYVYIHKVGSIGLYLEMFMFTLSIAVLPHSFHIRGVLCIFLDH